MNELTNEQKERFTVLQMIGQVHHEGRRWYVTYLPASLDWPVRVLKVWCLWSHELNEHQLASRYSFAEYQEHLAREYARLLALKYGQDFEDDKGEQQKQHDFLD